MTLKELRQLKQGRVLRDSCRHTRAGRREYVRLLHKQLREETK